jgi:hypothetical protein
VRVSARAATTARLAALSRADRIAAARQLRHRAAELRRSVDSCRADHTNAPMPAAVREHTGRLTVAAAACERVADALAPPRA